MNKPFVKKAIRNKFKKNIERMPDKFKERYDYIWVAVMKYSDNICQFDNQGNEVMWQEVRDSDSDVEALFWIPVNRDDVCYGIEAENPEPVRRVAVDIMDGKKEKRYYYAIADDKKDKADKFLFIDPKGNTKETDDYNFNPDAHFG